VHSWEDDTEEYRIYKPSHYRFPRSRPRHGIEFKENGEFIYHKIDQTDRIVKVEGFYEITSDDTVLVNFKDEKYKPIRYTVVSISDEVLKIRRGY
jgi:hypothetical protein